MLPVHASVTLPEVPRVILVGDRVHVKPVEGEIDDVGLIAPVKPLAAVTVIVEVPVTPELTETVVGHADTLKSVTV